MSLKKQDEGVEKGEAPSWPEPKDIGPVVVEGPYGSELDPSGYGTVVLFATDIGIAGQLPYVTHLLRCFHRSDAKVRRLVLYWQIESECELPRTLLKFGYLVVTDFGKTFFKALLEIYSVATTLLYQNTCILTFQFEVLLLSMRIEYRHPFLGV